MAQYFVNSKGIPETATGSKESPFVSLDSALGKVGDNAHIILEDDQDLNTDLSRFTLSGTGSVNIKKMGIVLNGSTIKCNINLSIPDGVEVAVITKGTVTFGDIKINIKDSEPKPGSMSKVTVFDNYGHFDAKLCQIDVKVNRELELIKNSDTVEVRVPNIRCCGGKLLVGEEKSKVNKIIGNGKAIIEIIGFRVPGYIYGTSKTNIGFELFSGPAYLLVLDVQLSIIGRPIPQSLINFTNDNLVPNPLIGVTDGKFVDSRSLGFIYNSNIDGVFSTLCNFPEKIKVIGCTITPESKCKGPSSFVSKEVKIIKDTYLLSDGDSSNILIDMTGRLDPRYKVDIFVPKGVKLSKETLYFKVIGLTNNIVSVFFEGAGDVASMIRLNSGQYIKLFKCGDLYYVKYKN